MGKMGKDELCVGALKSLVWGQGRRVLCAMGLERELGSTWLQVEELDFTTVMKTTVCSPS